MKKNILVCLMGSEVYVIWEKDGGILMQSIPRQQNRTKKEIIYTLMI